MERRVDYKNEVAVRVEIADCLLSDLLSRLTGASYTGPSTYQDNFTRTYGYDRNGNVTSRGTDTYTYDGNHLSTGTYDANGNLTAGQGQTVTYNLLNLPDTVQTSTHTVAYSYGADGTKLKKTATLTGSHFETETYYAGNLVFQILNLESILIEGGYIDMTGSTPAYRFYVMDHQGNIRAVTDGTGTVLRTNHYDPYGEEVLPVLTSASTLPTSTAGTDAASRYMYGAKEWDSNVSLYDFSARWYNPTGAVSFTTMDPLCEKYYSISPYAYCAGNPVNLVDPEGEDWRDYVKGFVRGSLTNIIPGSSSRRDISGLTSIEDYNAGLKTADLFSLSVGSALIAGGESGETAGTTLLITGSTATASVIAAPEGVTMAGTGAVVAAGSALAKTVGVMMLANTAHNSNSGYQHGSENKSDNNTKKTTSQLQKEVVKGKAPKSIERFDKAHSSKGQDHVHFKDKTSVNKDGSVHDAHHGEHKWKKAEVDYLRKYKWLKTNEQ